MRMLTPVVCLLGVLTLAGGAGAATLLVPSQYPTIQQAVNAASAGDEILIAPGVYNDVTHPSYPPDDTTKAVVVMRSNITLTGSGIDQTFIDGDSLGRGIYLRRCENVEIRHLTVRRAFAEDHGAAIYCYYKSSPYIHHVKIAGNYDGGITMQAGPDSTDGSHPRIEYCIMTDNEAKSGGGLDVESYCEPSIIECQIIGNRAPFAAGVRLLGSATLRNCVINNNETTSATNVSAGGVLIKDRARPVLSYCDISYNTVFGDGAGLCIEDASGELRRCTITNNESISLEGRGGGVCVLSGASPLISGCIIAGNSTAGAFSDGGGVWVQTAALELENTTLYGNSTNGLQPDYGNAGGIGMSTSFFSPYPISITHCIVASSTQGAGMYLTGSGPLPDIDCCDVWNNAGGNTIPVSGTGNFSQNPLLCDPAQGDYYLVSGSPCQAGNHPGGAGTCGGLGIGAYPAGCGGSGVEEPIAANALELRNLPNPFSGSTMIAFELPAAAGVSLEVFDLAGRQVAALFDGALPAGLQKVTWDGRASDGSQAPSGIYFYQLRIGETVAGRRMLCLR